MCLLTRIPPKAYYMAILKTGGSGGSGKKQGTGGQVRTRAAWPSGGTSGSMVKRVGASDDPRLNPKPFTQVERAEYVRVISRLQETLCASVETQDEDADDAGTETRGVPGKFRVVSRLPVSDRERSFEQVCRGPLVGQLFNFHG